MPGKLTKFSVVSDSGIALGDDISEQMEPIIVVMVRNAMRTRGSLTLNISPSAIICESIEADPMADAPLDEVSHGK